LLELLQLTFALNGSSGLAIKNDTDPRTAAPQRRYNTREALDTSMHLLFRYILSGFSSVEQVLPVRSTSSALSELETDFGIVMNSVRMGFKKIRPARK